MPDLRHDEHRIALGFLTVSQADALADSGVRVLDPFSVLISAGAQIGPGTVIYPSVVIQRDDTSVLTLGSGNALFPGTLLLAASGGRLVIGDDCELGPGVVQVKANRGDFDIRIGNGVRPVTEPAVETTD
jgi:UDP-3-O-[3-hydroxymyristoyl] glucosamine N-acyltransferase